MGGEGQKKKKCNCYWKLEALDHHKQVWKYYQPFWVRSQQGSSCPVSLLPIDWDQVQFRSKGQFYPLIKGKRPVSYTVSLIGSGQGCITGISVRGGGWGAVGDGGSGTPALAWLVLLTFQMARVYPAPGCACRHLESLCGVLSRCVWAAVLFWELESDTVGSRPLHTALYRQVKLD